MTRESLADAIGRLLEASEHVESVEYDGPSLRVDLRDGDKYDVEVLPRDGLDRRAVVGMFAHRAATLEDLSKELRERAGRAWANDRLEEAQVLKDLAREIKERATENRRLQQQHMDEDKSRS